jgi:hypothetical protein
LKSLEAKIMDGMSIRFRETDSRHDKLDLITTDKFKEISASFARQTEIIGTKALADEFGELRLKVLAMK